MSNLYCIDCEAPYGERHRHKDGACPEPCYYREGCWPRPIIRDPRPVPVPSKSCCGAVVPGWVKDVRAQIEPATVPRMSGAERIQTLEEALWKIGGIAEKIVLSEPGRLETQQDARDIRAIAQAALTETGGEG